MDDDGLARQMRELELRALSDPEVQRLRLQLDEARLQLQKEHLKGVQANGAKLDVVAKHVQLLVYVTAAHVGLGLGLDVGSNVVAGAGGVGAVGAVSTAGALGLAWVLQRFVQP